LLVASQTVREAADRQSWWALGLAMGASVLTLAAVALNLQPARFSPGDITLFLARMTMAWCWPLALLGLGRRYLTSSGPLLRYAREASYPVYILHQTVIVAVAYVVVGWHAGVALKYLLILLTASVATLLVYEFLVRRFNPVRFPFGMKPVVTRSGELTPVSVVKGDSPRLR
jgi:peptidoglycan/LPS O-acetylase OafA/YrhL